jgi:hypothetical protein
MRLLWHVSNPRIGALGLTALCVLCSLLAVPQSQAAPRAGVQEPSATAVSGDHYFEFHSGFWVNLHHFLYEEAIIRSANPQGKRHEAELTQDSSLSASLSGDEKADWDAAVSYYQNNLVTFDLLTSDRMRVIKNQLEGLENATTLSRSRLEPSLARALDRAAPVYRAHWWQAHDKANRDWIAAAGSLVDENGDKLVQNFTTAYDVAWPETPLRVDVVAYAYWSGAYTTMHPNRIVVSSIDPANQKTAALEVLFHEASHALIEKVGALVIQDFAAHRRNAPSDLWHSILYFTAGYFVKQLYPDYTPFADAAGLWSQGNWPAFHAALVKDWQPHLEGKAAVPQAVSELVNDAVAPQPSPGQQ